MCIGNQRFDVLEVDFNVLYFTYRHLIYARSHDASIGLMATQD